MSCVWIARLSPAALASRWTSFRNWSLPGSRQIGPHQLDRLSDAADHAGSILFGEHHGQDPDRDFRIGGVGRVDSSAAVEIVDLPDDADAIDGHGRAVVFAPGIVVGVEVGEGRDSGEDGVDRFPAREPQSRWSSRPCRRGRLFSAGR